MMDSITKTIFYISKCAVGNLRKVLMATGILRQVKNWVWFPLVQKELDKFVDRQNAHRIRKQKDTALPSGGRPDQFYTNPSNYGGLDCLIPVDIATIDELLEESGEGISKMRYVEEEFEPLAKEAYTAIGSPDIRFESAWVVFRQIVDHLEAGIEMESP